MKIKITEARIQPVLRSGTAEGGNSEFRSRPVSVSRFPLSAFPRAERGLALVITLILLSVTLVMTIAFLALSKRERASVTTSTETAIARLAADSALDAAQAQILANIFTTSAALYNYHLLVSTNYINGYGYAPGVFSPTNVNFDYDTNNNFVFGADFNQNVANLLFLPRAPVLVSTNEINGRYYLDLNRNGVFEASGDGVLNTYLNSAYVNGNQVINAGGSPGPLLTNGTLPGMVGDPQWVGILERPGTLHAADNKFVSRYAFIALPVGESLDLNAIHNQVKNTTLGTQDGFFRNQNLGSWEINFAAFLADLNTNQWLPSIAPDNNYYSYFQPIGSANRGVAFDNARALLTWRYGNNYNSQPLLSAAFTNFANPLANETFDIYPTGPLVTNLATTFYLNPNSIPWAGFPSFNRFFALPSELFDSAKSSTGLGSFTNHLHLAGETVANDGARPTYDRYTYYRMLDQLGTDTAPADDRMNLNYDNLDYAGNIVPGAETNLIAWTPLRFFTNAADRLLRTYTTNWFHKNPSNFLATYYRITGASANFYHQDGFGNVITNDPTGFGLTNIPYFGMTNELPAFGIGNVPVLVSNTLVYSPSINRLLQLAANIYDASTNEFYPHVFRPQFYRNPTSGDVFIVGYQEVVSVDKTAQGGIGDVQMARPIQVEQLNSGYSTANYPVGINVYGVPWIIGAKKYLPNFNTFYSYNTLQVSRKLQFTRTAVEAWNPGTTSIHFRTNQMFLMSITNHLGFSFWNSYVSNYPGIAPVVFAGDDIRMRLSYGAYSYSSSNYFSWFTNPAVWEGSYWDLTKAPGGRGDPNQFSFLSRRFDFPFVREAALSLDQSGTPVGSGFTTPVFNPAITSLPTFPDFKIESTNLFQGFIIDDGHVIDYVQLSGPISSHQAEADLKDLDYNSGVSKYLFWATNANAGGLNYGVVSQIEASKKGDLTDNIWKAPANIPSGLSGRENEAQFFAAFFTASNIVKNGRTFSNTNLQQQAPFTPVRTVTTPTIWTANDPLVHYLSSDLNAPLTGLANAVWPNDNPYSSTLPTPDLGGIPGGTPIPQRYQPWGTGGQMDEIAGDTRFTFNLGLKDSLVTGSDDWNFPTSRYPSAGWLGRVHRGTPWQTVYLKATNIWEYIDAGKVLAPNLGQQAWLAWLGDDDEYDGKNSRPIQDALLFDIFTAALHPNATLGALSVNQTHLAAWSALLSGMMAMTNTTDVPSFDFRPVLTNLVIEPAGINNVDSPLWKIVWGADGINNTRTNKNIFADGAFTRIGDILRVPALTEQSPFINRNNVDASGTGLPFGDQRLQMDISDAQYEWLPQQMLGLLRCTTAPRYVIYSYGQTLKPAIGGTVLDSAFFGLVTNYQVVAESATRTVLSVQPVITTKVINGVVVPTTNYTTRVESFNPLPPE